MNTNMNCEKLAVSPTECAKLLGIGMAKMYDLIHVEGFPAIWVGHRVLIPVEQLKIWLANEANNKQHIYSA